MYKSTINNSSHAFENWDLPYSQLFHAFGWFSLCEIEGISYISDPSGNMLEASDAKTQLSIGERLNVINSEDNHFNFVTNNNDIKTEFCVTENEYIIKTGEYIGESATCIKVDHHSTQSDIVIGSYTPITNENSTISVDATKNSQLVVIQPNKSTSTKTTSIKTDEKITKTKSSRPTLNIKPILPKKAIENKDIKDESNPTQTKDVSLDNNPIVTYFCDECSYSTHKNRYLTKHKDRHTATRENLLTCDECTYSTNTKRSLADHKKTHSIVDGFNCPDCDKVFAKKKGLIQHISIHAVQKAFQCNMCPKTFTTKINLTTHIRTHTGEKPFICEICTKGFSQKIALTKHLTIHKDDSEFVCKLCLAGFKNQILLTRHEKLDH